MKRVRIAIMAAASLLLAVAVFTACEKEELPTAGFTYSPMEIIQWDEVSFTNTSDKADSYSWDFGDGSVASTEESPTHQYTVPGTYTVTLTATNADGDKSVMQDLTVSAPMNKYMVAGVEYSIDTAYAYTSMHGGGNEWRMLGDAFDKAPAEAVNLLKFSPNMGTGTLEGNYTADTSMSAGVGSFTYGLTANYQGFLMDSTTYGSAIGTLEITKFAEDIYEFKLEGGELPFGEFNFMTGAFNASGYKPSYSVIFRGPVTPVATMKE